MDALGKSDKRDSAQKAWNKIVQLRPKLRPHTQFYRHQYRGRDWYVLADRMTSAHFRCGPGVYQFAQLLDGQSTVEQAFAQVCKAQRHSAGAIPQREEIIRVLADLQNANLLEGDGIVDLEHLFLRQRQQSQSKWRQRLLRPFALQFALLDPDSWLNKNIAWVKPLFSRSALLLWVALLSWALLLAVSEWPALVEHYQARFVDPQNLIWLFLLYPLIKGLHELGHAFATKFWGGEVHEMGVMLLVFMPLPYVNASACSAFDSKYRRMVVGAAGIMVELALAALAMLVWTQLAPGVGRDIALDIALIGSVSTLLFNGNPLLRFDAYYVLADALEIPNLGGRSQQYLGYLVQRYVLGMEWVHNPLSAEGERGWLLSYALLSGIYRIFISLTIAFYIAGKFFIVGVLLALWALFAQLVLPFWQRLSRVVPAAIEQGRGVRLFSVISLVSAAVLLFLFVLPLTHSTSAKGIVTLSETAMVRAEADGFVRRVYRKNGQTVVKGEPLFQLENNTLAADIAGLKSKRDELTIRYNASLSKDRVERVIIKEQLQALAVEIAQLQAQLQGLLLLSPTDGVLSLAKAGDLPGRFIDKGEVIAYVADLGEVNARVVVAQQSVDLVRRHTQRIEVRLVSEPGATLLAELAGEVPAATDQLPSRALGTQAGGDIAVDARDSEGRKTIGGVFQFDISLPVKASGRYLGQGVRVRFIHQREPLGWRWYGHLKQFFETHPQFLSF